MLPKMAGVHKVCTKCLTRADDGLDYSLPSALSRISGRVLKISEESRSSETLIEPLTNPRSVPRLQWCGSIRSCDDVSRLLSRAIPLEAALVYGQPNKS